jgi:hypothetical protein
VEPWLSKPRLVGYLGECGVRTHALSVTRQTRYIVYVRIGEPACKHGVPEEDIWHAVRNALRKVTMDDDLAMLIGPARDGSLLEVGVLDIDGDDPVVIHAMPLRSKFYPFLGQGR